VDRACRCLSVEYVQGSTRAWSSSTIHAKEAPGPVAGSTRSAGDDISERILSNALYRDRELHVVGAGVGCVTFVVAAFTRDEVGLPVGSSLGGAVGSRLGFGVGASVCCNKGKTMVSCVCGSRRAFASAAGCRLTGDDVGSFVGFSLGFLVGASVGFSLGSFEGASLGVLVGAEVGRRDVGLSVGNFLSNTGSMNTVGYSVSNGVERWVGGGVGFLVGEAVGFIVGVLVGFLVGAFVGSLVGEAVGSAVVGASVS